MMADVHDITSPTDTDVGVKLENEFGAGGDTTDRAPQPQENEVPTLAKIAAEVNHRISLGLLEQEELFEVEKKDEGYSSPKPSASSSGRGSVEKVNGENALTRRPSSTSLPTKTRLTPEEVSDFDFVVFHGNRKNEEVDVNANVIKEEAITSNTSVKVNPGRSSLSMPVSASSMYNGPIGETVVDNCSASKEGHVCLDCFPIPDELLVQLHRQSGMSKMMCLQLVQTVIKFYKQDLKCAKFFVPNSSSNPVVPNEKGDTFSEYTDSSSFNESILLFKNLSLVPPQKESVTERVALDEYENEPDMDMDEQQDLTETAYFSRIGKVSTPKHAHVSKPKPTVSGTERFQSLIYRLKTEPVDFWDDPQNASYVFTFFRKLNKLAVRVDRSVLKRFLLDDDMDFVWILTRFLRRERRWSIKWEIIGVIGTIAARDARARRKILESDFSTYLARAVTQFDSDPARLAAYAELLTVLFTGGKPLPISLLEHFGEEFVVSILSMIEDDDSRPGWALPETFLKLLLAYNLQFSADDVYDNLTIAGITRVRECKIMTSFLVDWMETKDRPLTSSWDVSVSLHQCVIKLSTDIFSCRTTSYVFSNSQSLILLRLLINSLPKFLPGDKRRTSYLKLVEAILRHCKYHYVHNTPSLESLTDILTETSSLSYRDQEVVRKIFKQFPQHRHDVDDVF